MKKNKLWLFLKRLSFGLLAFLVTLSFVGCGGSGEESDNPDDMLTLEGTITTASSAADGALSRAIAANGDMVFLYLNGAATSSSQIKDGKYSFYGGYKGRKVSFQFGSSINQVYVGLVDTGASGTIKLPVFNEYHVIVKNVIDVQMQEGRTKLENFLVSNNRLDITSSVNKLKELLAAKFVSESDVYGTSVQQLMSKLSNGEINTASAFSYTKLSMFADPPKSMVIYPTSSSAGVREKIQFGVSMSGFTDRSVVYRVNDIPGGNSEIGTVTQEGLYTAPGLIDIGASVSVSAQSSEDTTKQASAIVVLTPVVVSINNSNATLNLTKLDKNYTVPSQVAGHSDKTLRWFINDIEYGNILTVGYISSNGTYAQPVKTPGVKIFVKAVSVADPTKYALCEIVISE